MFNFLCLEYSLISVSSFGCFIGILESQAAEQSIVFFLDVSSGTINLANGNPTNSSLSLSAFQLSYKLNKDICSSSKVCLRLRRQANLYQNIQCGG